MRFLAVALELPAEGANLVARLGDLFGYAGHLDRLLHITQLICPVFATASNGPGALRLVLLFYLVQETPRFATGLLLTASGLPLAGLFTGFALLRLPLAGLFAGFALLRLPLAGLCAGFALLRLPLAGLFAGFAFLRRLVSGLVHFFFDRLGQVIKRALSLF